MQSSIDRYQSAEQGAGDMDIQSEVIAILQSTLGLPEGSIAADPAARVLGVIPEMDSMSVVGVLTTLEEQYGIAVDDDEIDAQVFATVGSLTAFVESKLSISSSSPASSSSAMSSSSDS